MYGFVSCPSDQYLVKVYPSPPTPGHGSSRTATVGVPPSSVDTPKLQTHPGSLTKNWLLQRMDSHHIMFSGRVVLDVYTKDVY